jgi:RNA polymerase sigma-70 factor (ECF subfamily)
LKSFRAESKPAASTLVNAVTTPVLHPSSAAVERPGAGPPGLDPAERIMVTAALAGDDEAFEAVIRTYSRRVYVVAYAIVQDVAEAEDIVQDTFLKAHNQRAKLREAEKFPAWLLTVARNAARDRLRRRKPQAGEEAFATLADHNAATPGSEMERVEHQGRLRRALATLPEEHRTALTLRYLEGLDYRAIESQMGLTNGALRGILGRALGTLRRMPALRSNV